MSLNLDDIFSCKQITTSSLNLYKTKLRILNDNKPIKNINYLYSISSIKNKIDKLKPNTRRTYIIAITSILRCLTNPDKKPPKKLKKLYDDYSKILDEYNTSLKDQTEITEGTKVLTTDEISNIYDEIKLKASKNDANKQEQQDYLILSLYTLLPPRRNKDYIYMKVVDDYSQELSKDYNYYDGSKFYYNVYKTRGKYGEVILDVPKDLKTIINNYINKNNIKNDDFLLTNKNNNDLTKNTNKMTLILNRIFKEKVGSSMLRRSFLTNKYSKERDELNADTIAMSTSVQTANSNYIKKT
jgi:hypothetical protein